MQFPTKFQTVVANLITVWIIKIVNMVQSMVVFNKYNKLDKLGIIYWQHSPQVQCTSVNRKKTHFSLNLMNLAVHNLHYHSSSNGEILLNIKIGKYSLTQSWRANEICGIHNDNKSSNEIFVTYIFLIWLNDMKMWK